MKKRNNAVNGITALPTRPDWRGFLVLAVVLSGPFAIVVLGIEVALRWGFWP